MPDGTQATDQGIVREILDGLQAPQKTLPPKLFYDPEGCRLFGVITDLPEYYVTRAERAVLVAHAAEIASFAEPGSALVEYGASDEAKAEHLLETGRFAAYVPIDIADAALEALAARLRRSRPGLRVEPVATDFLQPFLIPGSERGDPRFGFFPGSTIGNLEPASVVRFLTEAARTLGGPHGARFVIGTDLRKDPARLIPAYDDASGVTAAFNRNILAHVNRIADGRFDPDHFDHQARWNDAESRIEMHLVSRTQHDVPVAGTTIRFEAGESIHTESSYKHTRDAFHALAARAGWHPRATWQDPDGLFGVHLLHAD